MSQSNRQPSEPEIELHGPADIAAMEVESSSVSEICSDAADGPDSAEVASVATQANQPIADPGATRGRSSLPPSARYRPITPLSSGGMANVELAVGIDAGNFKKLVVLKTIREELAFDPELVAMFLSEARLCARLNHSNLVHVYEVLAVPRPCIVMEYLEGISLVDIQRALRQEFDTKLQLRILSDVLAGLQYAHELCDYDGTPLEIVHRDVSPQNVIVTSEGRVKVLDFGIAKMANNPSFTQAGMVKGKMSYMSPEQLAGETLDCRTDVFAVGCMLWRAASGKKLWANTAPEEIMRALVMGKIPPPSIHRDVDPRLEAIVMRATAPNRKDRYPSATALRIAVDEYLVAAGCEYDLREWMQGTFAAHWDRQRENIHALLSNATSMPPPVVSVPPVEVESDPSTAHFELARPVSRTSRVVTIGIVAVAVGLLLVGAVRLLEFIQPDANTEGATVSAVQAGHGSGDEQGQAQGLGQDILLRLRAEPATAQFLVDGAALAGNPAELRVTAGVEHVVEVSLKGYGTLTRRLSFDRETSLEFALVSEEPIAASAAAPASRAPRRARAGHAKSLTPAANAAPVEGSDPCDIPFYFKDGIKTYKPECL